MIIRSNISEAVKSLIGAKQRSSLALIGIIVGIGSVIAMVSIGSIVQAEALRQFMEMGTDVVTISKRYIPGEKKKETLKLTVKNAMDIPARCPGIKSVAPYSISYNNLKFEKKKFSVPGMGVTSSFLTINKLVLEQGRFIHDLDEYMFFCVLGYGVAKKLKAMGTRNLIGQRVLFNEKYFTIIGELKEAAMGGMRPYEINNSIIVPVSTIQRMFPNANIKNIMARTTAPKHNAIAGRQVKTYYKSLYKFDVDVRSAEELIAQMQKQMRLYTLLLGAIGSISLIVGGIGVMNVMLVSVTERTKEIGIRRALGARQGDIQLQFLIESVILCIIGGMIGIGIGVGVSYIISFYAKWHFAVSYESIMLGVAVSVTVGVFFGFYPARQAAKLSPIMALRSD